MKQSTACTSATADLDGHSTVLVQVTGSPTPAVLDRKDFEDLESRGLARRPWFLQRNGHGRCYVRIAHPDYPAGQTTVAREILRCPPTAQVRYRDADTLNLRRENLLRRSRAHRSTSPSSSLAGGTTCIPKPLRPVPGV
jgi:hypothetical protein